ncbi:sulfatase-like hydrolase/transferase [Rhodopirellula halodulae]|uniref:sulfatase-like hydrolase/transferase n=1 Tax=Rhodopirellula halodulae TaxID=2894198 RepID=UPI0036F40C96
MPLQTHIIFAIAVCLFASHGLSAAELDPQQSAWHAKYKKQVNAPLPEEMLLNTDAEPNLSEGFTSLFNGKDLQGWTVRGGTCTFEVQDDTIVGKVVPGSNSTYLSTERDFGDFVFSCEMKWEEQCNSGVMFRAQTKANSDGTETVFGPQAEMEGVAKDRHWSGGIYGQSCNGFFYPLWLKEHADARAAFRPNEWNRLTISARGKVVKTWVNGVPAAHWVDDGTYSKGFFGLQMHKGATGEVHWRNLRMKSLTHEPVAKVSPTPSKRPNVLFILADDLGWSDTTLFGTTKLYQTPNLERLAERGMTFTRAYSSSPLCSPTRASVLTGLSPARHGITSPTCHLPRVILKPEAPKTGPPNKFSTVPSSVSRLDTKYYTLAEMFRDNGYATGHFGKWHLGAEPYSPLEHGFDVDVPHHPGPGPAGSYVAPWKFKDFDHDPMIPDEHLEDRMAKEAVRFLEQHSEQPFFLNYWMFSVHAPFDAKAKLIDKYREKVDPEDAQRSPTYAAMIESMDDAIGTLLDTLDRLGIADETIIIFASDNGGNMYNQVDGTTPTSNAPLRGGKASMYEGGVRGPAIVVQPGVVRAGSTSDAIVQSVDYYPTLLEMLSIDPQPGQSFDGVSIVPALNGDDFQREPIFTYFPHAPGVPDWLPPSVSVHHGDWKLIRIFHGGEDGGHRYKLFHLKDDISEEHNLAAEHPQRVKQLDNLIEQHLVATHAVRPLANPNFDPAKYDIAAEGKATLKGGANAPKRPKSKVRRKPVAGWLPAGTCDLTLAKNFLKVESSGGDPHFSHAFPETIPGRPMTFVVEMKSNSSGRGQVFWKETQLPYSAERSEGFDVNHDGVFHTYSIELSPSGTVQGVRLDPSNGPGIIQIRSMRLQDENDQVIHEWSFGK